MHSEEIKKLIETGLSECTAIVESPDGHHFQARVTSSQFTGKTRLQQQQLVYAVLKDYLMRGEIHALSLKTFTPTEWQQ